VRATACVLLSFDPVVLPEQASFITTTELESIDGGVSLTLIASLDPDELGKIQVDETPGSGSGLTYIVGVDADSFASGEPDAASPEGFLQLVLDRNEPPIPFDDPAVLGITRDQFAWYLPLVGSRYLGGGALVEDASRARGSFIAFDAVDADEARWLAAQDPWARVGQAFLFRYPAGVFRKGHAPPGPGVQRREPFVCPKRVGKGAARPSGRSAGCPTHGVRSDGVHHGGSRRLPGATRGLDRNEGSSEVSERPLDPD